MADLLQENDNVMFDLYKAIHESAKWSEIAGLPYTDIETLSQKTEAYVEEDKELNDSLKEKNVDLIIDGCFDVMFTGINMLLTKSMIPDNSNITTNIYNGSARYEDPLLSRLYPLVQSIVGIIVFRGYDPQRVWDIGIDNNFSKFLGINNVGLAHLTINRYVQLGIEINPLITECEGKEYRVFKTIDKEQRDPNGKIYFPNKIVKPFGWEEPNWDLAKNEYL